MIAYEIQLQYVIRYKIKSETKFGPRQIQSETKSKNSKIFTEIKVCQNKNNSQILSQTEFILD